MEQFKEKRSNFIIEMFSNIGKGFSYSISDEENPDLPRDNTKEIEKMHQANIDNSLVSNKKSEKNGSSYRKGLKAKVTRIIDEDIEYDEDLENDKIIEEG